MKIIFGSLVVALLAASPAVSKSGSVKSGKKSKKSKAPLASPSIAPSASPSAAPSAKPSAKPSASPSAAPSAKPSASPSAKPSANPSANPSSIQCTYPELTDPGTNAPLGVCEGNCNVYNPNSCEGGLQCFERPNQWGGVPVPGCNGAGVFGNNYCILPPNPSLTYIGGYKPDPGTAPTSLGLCEGDCDRDSDCVGTLECFFRNALEPVPGCTGLGVSGMDYCYDPSTPTLATAPIQRTPLTYIGPFPTSLELCEGDCDDDSDCAGALVCFQRNGLTPVPGCSGPGLEGRDYCVDPNRIPFALCEGNCYSDAECAAGLVCYQRNDYAYVPGCGGDGEPGYNYCVDPSSIVTQQERCD